MEAKNIDHGQRAHARLSASGSSRWLNCTPSASLEDSFPDTSSVFAEEGTLAHEIAEIKLRLREHHTQTRTLNKLLELRLDEARKHELYLDEMEAYTDQYCDYVTEAYAVAKASDSAAIIETEIKVDLTAYIPAGFGTVDNAIVANKVLDVIDLKYGKGVRVSAVDNSQLKLYALGTLEAYAFMYDIEVIRMHIHQPRLDAVSVFEIPAHELIEWGRDYVKPKALEAHEGKGELQTGSWCGFCKAKIRCSALAKETEALAVLDFQDPRLLTDAQLLEIYAKADRLSRWLNSLGEFLYSEALAGKKWDGLKLVEGRSNRTIEDATKAVNALRADGYADADILSSKLVGIGALEKLLGKAGFEAVLGDLVVKPAGKPTLVDSSDKRAEISLISDFD